ncbi:MAG: hypothetical protein JSR17_13525 [Proteobacteria bacterium]|nr:hypothetical protein [Pseudomonadota bacterium]
MNTHIFTVRQVRNLYKLVIKGKFINFNSYLILRLTPNETAKKALEDMLKTLDWHKEDEALIGEIKTFIATYNAANLHPIDDHVWSDFVKRYFQNGSIIDNDSLVSYNARNILLRQLRNPAFQDSVHMLPEFIGQLYAQGFHTTAEVIHNYLFFAVRAVQGFKNQPQEVPLALTPPAAAASSSDQKEKQPLIEAIKSNGMDPKAVAIIMSPALLDGLDINGKILGNGMPETALKEESVLMAKILETFLKNPPPIFLEEFHSRAYRDVATSKQNDFEKEIAALNNILDKLTMQDFSLSEIAFGFEQSDQKSEKSKVPLLRGILSLLSSDKPANAENSSARKRDSSPRRGQRLDSPSDQKKASPKELEMSPSARMLIGRTPPKDRGAFLNRQSSQGRMDEHRQVTFQRTATPTSATSPRDPSETLEMPGTPFLPVYQLVALMPVDAQVTVPRAPSSAAYYVSSAPVDIPARRSADGAVQLNPTEDARGSPKSPKSK